ncbi:hypothetical protein [Salegentibacter chungangensis]|uniref:Uncharacterized protein n=1 Tax=Salegentibacter chungangensis TaxID=1335724 RepID=A0ABW3NRB5_9FLAO
MKNVIAYLILIPSFLLSCSIAQEKSGKIEGNSGINYNESKEMWAEMKEVNGNSYSYTLEFISWTGAGSRTTITVKDGIVAERYYEAFLQKTEDGEHNEEITETYTETNDEIGSHEAGAEPLSVDELYELCLAEYLVVNETENTIYFNTTQQGVISECGYVPENCVDDCFRGFQMSHFEWL